jgi:hypothetical protein
MEFLALGIAVGMGLVWVVDNLHIWLERRQPEVVE